MPNTIETGVNPDIYAAQEDVANQEELAEFIQIDDPWPDLYTDQRTAEEATLETIRQIQKGEEVILLEGSNQKVIDRILQETGASSYWDNGVQPNGDPTLNGLNFLHISLPQEQREQILFSAADMQEKEPAA